MESRKHLRQDGDADNLGNTKRTRESSGLRSSDADLKVIVGSDGDKEEYWCFRQVLAKQSVYIDTLLAFPSSADGNEEGDDYREITFPDITPKEWERMMECLDDPFEAIESLKQEEAQKLVVLYHKYDFPMGIKICDEALSKKYLPELHHKLFDPRHYKQEDIEEFVELVCLSTEMNLRVINHIGKMWLFYFFETLKTPYPQFRPWFHRRKELGFPFTAMQIRRLIPTIVKDSECHQLRRNPFGCGEDIFNVLDDLGNEWDRGPKGVLMRDFDHYNKLIRDIRAHCRRSKSNFGFSLEKLISVDKYEISHDSFPEFFLTTLKGWHKKNQEVGTKWDEVDLTMSASNENGNDNNLSLAGSYNYDHAGDGYLLTLSHENDGNYSYISKLNDYPNPNPNNLGRWVIQGYDPCFLYKCPDSQFAMFPPESGWVPVDEKDAPIPTVKIRRRVH